MLETDRSDLLRLYAEACERALSLRKYSMESFYPELETDKVRFITDGLKQATEPSWRPWRIILKAAYGYPLDPEELAFFRSVAQRDPPRRRVRELWLIVGRRGGKDSIASLIATTAARYADTSRLRPGEEGIVACIACTRDQAEIVWKYIKGYFDTIPELRSWLATPKMGNQRIELKNKVEIRVATNNYRAPRGRAIICAILDECLVAGTQIETEFGKLAIEELKPGDRVWTRQGLRPVVAAKQTATDAVLWRVTLCDGRSLTGTANHPVYVVGRGFVALQSLVLNDEVLSWHGEPSVASAVPQSAAEARRRNADHAPQKRGFLSSLLTVTRLSNGADAAGIQTRRTATTETATESCYTGLSTWRNTASFLRKSKFTTKTKTRLILLSTILKHSILASIKASMNRAAGLTLPLSSTVRVLAACGPTEHQLKRPARIVENYSLPLECEHYSVNRTAKLPIIEMRTEKNTIALPEKDNEQAIGRVKNVTRLTERGAVYNLEVADCPEYYANGVLVHNCAFYRAEDSATPDIETYRALQPGMAMIPDSMIIGISSPHKESGLLHQKYMDHFGKDHEDVLIIQAPTRSMNPMIDVLDPGLIDKAVVDDPQLASAEYFAEFRRDLADYVSREVVEGCIVPARIELEPDRNLRYTAFCDPSGGSNDSMTLAIAHRDKAGKGVLDLLREHRAPFKPDDAVADFAVTLREYNLARVTGDRYGDGWTRERFRAHGVSYEVSELTKSDIYREFLPLLNTQKVELLDKISDAGRRMFSQLMGLERRTIRGGRDSFDHPHGQHDDLVNVAAGVLVKVTTSSPMIFSDEFIKRSAIPQGRTIRVH